MQERLVAIHHLDAPYRPRDLIQRDGRGIRQGNRNKIIRIYTYAEERTFDSYSYQILETKQRFISQVEKGDMTVREADDIDEATLSYAEIKAITSERTVCIARQSAKGISRTDPTTGTLSRKGKERRRTCKGKIQSRPL